MDETGIVEMEAGLVQVCTIVLVPVSNLLLVLIRNFVVLLFREQRWCKTMMPRNDGDVSAAN